MRSNPYDPDIVYETGRENGYMQGHSVGRKAGIDYGQRSMFLKLINQDLAEAAKSGRTVDIVISREGIAIVASILGKAWAADLNTTSTVSYPSPYGSYKMTINHALEGFRWEVIDRV